MKTVAIIAPTGMLGSMVYKVLKEKYNLVLVYRNIQKLELLERAYGGTQKHKIVHFDISSIYSDFLTGFVSLHTSPKAQDLYDAIGNVDGIINCAGIIKPHSLKDPAMTFFINGFIPHMLAEKYGKKLIHITTDCVYSGIEQAPYDERSSKSPNDLYGCSKSMGEPKDRSLVLRTSIIGPELDEGSSLIAWFKKQSGKTIKGFTTHMWNGITTKQYGKICDQIISNRSEYPDTGLFHVYGSDVTKFDMIQAFKNKYQIDVTIEPSEPPTIDRRLRSLYDLNKKLSIPDFKTQLDDLD